MSFAIALTDEQWELVADLFEPPGRRCAPSVIPRRQMVETMLFIARTGCQWRYLPERHGQWAAVWAQWRRWRDNGVWARSMLRLAAVVRILHEREPLPSMVMVDAQSVKGGRARCPAAGTSSRQLTAQGVCQSPHMEEAITRSGT